MLQELVLATDIDQTGKSDLSNDSTELARSGGDTVTGRPVAGREDLARNDKGSAGRIGVSWTLFN